MPAIAAPTAALSSPTPRGGGKVRLLGACVVDCVWCGDHNRVLKVTPDGVIARCLRCDDYAWLSEVPSSCPEFRNRRSPETFESTTSPTEEIEDGRGH